METAVDFIQKTGNAKVYGELLPSETSKSDFVAFAQYLVHNAVGALVHEKLFSAIIYPSGAQGWDFLGTSTTIGTESHLRFAVQDPLPGFLALANAGTAKTINLNIPDFSKDRLFSGFGGKAINQIAFLMFPPSSTSEITMVASYLQSLGVGVYCAGT